MNRAGGSWILFGKSLGGDSVAVFRLMSLSAAEPRNSLALQQDCNNVTGDAVEVVVAAAFGGDTTGTGLVFGASPANAPPENPNTPITNG